MMMRVCQISVFMECRQRRRVQILLIIDKINLCPSVYSESSASGNINYVCAQAWFDLGAKPVISI